MATIIIITLIIIIIIINAFCFIKFPFLQYIFRYFIPFLPIFENRIKCLKTFQLFYSILRLKENIFCLPHFLNNF